MNFGLLEITHVDFVTLSLILQVKFIIVRVPLILEIRHEPVDVEADSFSLAQT